MAATTELQKARITPGSRAEIGIVNDGIARAIGLATGGPPPAIFTTLGRHRSLFRKWLRFASGLMPGGTLPRQETELLILRTAHNCGCDYEWGHHAHLALETGLTSDDVERAAAGPDEPGWSDRQRLLLRAADELHADREIGDALWAELAAGWKQRHLIEICMLVGHYEMVAMTLNSLRVQPDPPPTRQPPRAVRMIRARIEKGAS